MLETKTRQSDREAKTEPLLIDEKEAADLLGFSVRTLQTWRFRGGGPPFIGVSSRCVRYQREDLVAWIAERRRLSTTDPGPDGRSPARGRDRLAPEG